MIVNAKIVNPDKIDEQLFFLQLNEMPITGRSIFIEDIKYSVCRTLFYKKEIGCDYEFEQVITKSTRNHNEKYTILLLMGSVILTEVENDIIFKEVNIITESGELYSSENEIYGLPYSYINIFDSIRLNNNSILMSNEIHLEDKGTIKIIVKNNHYPINSFRQDQNRFCERFYL